LSRQNLFKTKSMSARGTEYVVIVCIPLVGATVLRIVKGRG